MERDVEGFAHLVRPSGRWQHGMGHLPDPCATKVEPRWTTSDGHGLHQKGAWNFAIAAWNGGYGMRWAWMTNARGYLSRKLAGELGRDHCVLVSVRNLPDVSSNRFGCHCVATKVFCTISFEDLLAVGLLISFHFHLGNLFFLFFISLSPISFLLHLKFRI